MKRILQRPTALLCVAFLAVGIPVASARVVISEVMWAGSDLSSADEWVELTVVGSGADISGWSLWTRQSSGSGKAIVTFSTGTTIGSGQYFLVSNYESAHSRLDIDPDIVTTSVSLPNTKLLLWLTDESGTIVDMVDDGVGVPFAGRNESGSGGIKASMERINLSGSGMVKANWATAFVAVNIDSGSTVLGTPGARRSRATVPGAGRSEGGDGPGGGGDNGEEGEIEEGDDPEENGDDEVEEEEGSTTESGTIIIPSPIPSPILITEVLPNPEGRDDAEWIELGNVSTGTVLLDGLTLEVETLGSPRRFTIGEETGTGSTQSGTVLHPGEHRIFPKTETALPLRNKGDTVSLWSGSLLLSTLTYPAVPEAISFARSPNGSGELIPLCIPTPGEPNAIIPPDPAISVQSGSPEGTGKATLNLQAIVQTGSLAGASCMWQYGDGFVSDSCNPPSHTLREAGTYTITLTFTSYCGSTAERTLIATVTPREAGGGGRSGSSGGAGGDPACEPQSFSGVAISELLPNPYGSDADGEWIELANTTDRTVHLCGWRIDDEEGGSRPHVFTNETIPPASHVIIPRSQTTIALNNEGDEVRLFAPLMQSCAPGDGTDSGDCTTLVQSVPYAKAPDGETFALRSDGLYVWTPFPTPGEQNRFRSAQRRHPHDTVIVSAALPNPHGKDAEGEWIELSNITDEFIALNGWSLDNKAGSSKPYPLDGITLSPHTVRRFTIGETGITLVNKQDNARLLDPDGYTASLISWTEAVSGRIYRPPAPRGEPIRARVVHVVDGDTIDVSLLDLDDPNIPASVKRRWLSVVRASGPRSDNTASGTLRPGSGQATAHIRVRLIGIDTPETVHPLKAIEAYGIEASNFTKALLEGKNVTLAFDDELWDKYERLLAYVTPEGSNESIQARLLRAGLAFAYTRFPFLKRGEYLAYEAEARAAKLGLWSDGDAAKAAELLQDGAEQEAMIEKVGFTLSVVPAPGLVASGTVVRFTPSVKANVYLSVNSGAYMRSSGSTVVTDDVVLRAFAKRTLAGETSSGTTVLQSDVLEARYAVKQPTYETGSVVISEVYPAPPPSEKSYVSRIASRDSDAALEYREWIELYNPSSRDVALAGWQLDDVQGGGSAPWTVPFDVVIPARSYVLLTDERFSVAFNNTGDDVSLIAPNGTVVASIAYPKLKTGQSMALAREELCITDAPTPRAKNRCFTAQESSKATTGTTTSNKKVIQSFLSRSLRPRYRNILPDSTASAPKVSSDPLFAQIASLIVTKDALAANTIFETHNADPTKEVLFVSLILLGGLWLMLRWRLEHGRKVKIE